MLGAGALAMTAACDNSIGSNAGQNLDARADASMNFLATNFPGTTDLRNKSAGYLVMPLVT